MEDEVLESVREIFCFVNQRLSKFCVHYVRAWRDDESGLSRGGGLRNGRRGGVLFGRCKQAAANQPANCRLRRTLGDSDALREFLITDLNCFFPALLLGRKPQIDQETDRPAIVADQVAHEGISEIRIQSRHDYTGG